MAKTIVQKVGSPDPDVSVFRISGTLGFHENKVLVKFFQECASREIQKLVLDLSALDSMGGGCARIIRDAARDGGVRVCIVGASRTVQNFLAGKGDVDVLFAGDLEAAVSALRSGAASPSAADRVLPPERDAAWSSTPETRPPIRSTFHAAPGPDYRKPERPASVPQDALRQVDVLLQDRPAPADQPTPSSAPRAPARPVGEEPAPDKPTDEPSSEVRELKRKLVRYRALFSLNKQFSLIEDKARLLDAFLLSIVAQVGVESAAFLELADDRFNATSWKGFETADPESLGIGRVEVDADEWLRSPQILPIHDAPISQEAKDRVCKWDLPLAAPFIVRDALRGIVLLGKPIRRAFDADSWEFLGMMFDQVAIAYENSCRLEKQSGRTLGLVHSLISMIENNTLSRGTTEMVMDFTYAVAVRMHYPEEHLRDLLYGTVLRDIGMLNMSNYIVRSPRELVQEEWEIIKQHTIEGAATLERMGFSEHACSIVRSHHERYNGEGYPDGLTGPLIPLGARILSVVESYSAMLHDRPNRPALTADEALNTLEENWGLRYDPEVVKVFSQTLEEDARAGGKGRPRGIDLIKG